MMSMESTLDWGVRTKSPVPKSGLLNLVCDLVVGSNQRADVIRLSLTRVRRPNEWIADISIFWFSEKLPMCTQVFIMVG